MSCPKSSSSRNSIVKVLTVMITMSAVASAIRAQDPKPSSKAVLSAAERSDSFETKIRLLEEAWKRQDYDLVRALTHSIRDTAVQTQNESQSPETSLIETSSFQTVDSLLPSFARWAEGWKYCKTMSLEETVGESRASEPVEMTLSFPKDQVTSLAREIRVAKLSDGRLIEVPSQVHHEVRRGNERSCKVIFMADSLPKQKQPYLIFYGNPDAELPEYPSDLTTQGEGVGLDISNSIYKASLSRQTGQLERMTLRREHGLEIFSGGQGHGEPPGIDWAHDYVDQGNFQKMRISLWDACPDYDVVRGPLCTIVRRWGFPRSPVHPVYSPSRLNVDVEYRFYSGLPWFLKVGSMTAVQSFEAEALRDDEWVFSGQSFTDSVWIARDGKLHIGDPPIDKRDDLWGVGFFHKATKDSFVAMFLEHSAQGLPELKHNGVPQMYYRWHGSVWSRYPLPDKQVPKGAVLHQKNAYLSIPFTEKEGPATVEKLRRCLTNPLVPTPANRLEKPAQKPDSESTTTRNGRLARPGEASDATISKKLIWDALRDCKDAQLYTADINVVDLGLVYDVRVRGDVVTVIMAMPHRGRPLLGYFIDGSISVHPTFSQPIRERLMDVPGVRQVVVDQTWNPGWNSNRLTDIGRKKLGLE